MIGSKLTKVAAIACVLVLMLGTADAGQATASWVFRGITQNINETVFLNVGDAFAIQCIGHGGTLLAQQAADTIMSFVVTTISPPTKVTITPSDGTTEATLSVDQGNLIYDSIQGSALQYSEIFTSVYEPIITPGKISTGTFTMLIPRLETKHFNTYYCAFTDGSASSSADGTTAVGVSSGVRLYVTTKAGSTAKRQARNKFLEYTALLATVSKLIF